MLQIYIEHFKNETVSINSIYDDDVVLSEINDNETNLDVCTPFINQEIKVHHSYVEEVENNYTLTAILEAVEVDPITKVKCIKYTPISK